jgi:hypothetical protein
MKEPDCTLFVFGTRWTKAGLFALFPVLLITVMLVGCKTNPQSGATAEQKALVSLAESLPPNSPPDEHVAVEAGLDSRARTVLELAGIFMTNRDWTESLPEEKLEAWRKSHPYFSPPVIIHSKQSAAAYRLTQLGPQAQAAAPAMIQSLTNSEFLTHQWAMRQTDMDPATEERADTMNRHWAIQVLQAIGSASPEVVPALVGVLHNHKDGYEAGQALIVLSLTDTNVLPLTIAKLESDPDSPEAEYSVQVLNGIGADALPAVPVLIHLLEHTNACYTTMYTLCAIGSNASPAVPALLHYYGQLQGDAYFAQRKWVVITLGRIGPGAQEAIPMLKTLQNKPYQSFDAIHSLWRIDPTQYTATAIAAAEKELMARATMLRSPACSLLAGIGPPAKSAIPLLLQKLDSPPDPGVAFNAAWALWRVDPSQKPRAVAVFENFHTNAPRYTDKDLSIDSVGALWQIEPERRKELRPAIIAMLKQWKDVPAVRYARPGMKTLLSALQDIADDPEYADLRPWAIMAIRQINGRGAEM